MIEKAGATLPFGCDQVFDLIADIERYPEFLPGWISARIRGRDAGAVDVEQVVGFGPVRLEFTSHAVLDRPRRIDVASTDPTFRKYRLSWAVTAAPGGCRISVVAELELRSRFLQYAVERFLPGAVGDAVAAFEARAHSLYARP